MLLCYSRGNGNSLLSKCKIDKGWNKHAIAQFQNRDIILTPLFQDNYFASKVFNEERFSNKNPKHRKAVDPQCFQPVMAVVFFFFSSVLETENTCVFTNGFGFLFGGLPCWLSCKESVCNAGDPGSIPGSGRSPREGSSYPLQYSGLENPVDRGAWQVTVHGVAKSGA